MALRMPITWHASGTPLATLFLSLFVQLRISEAASVSSCGDPAQDRLTNVSVTLSPDPINKGQAFTVGMTGTLDQALNAGFLLVDLDVKVDLDGIKLIDKKVDKKLQFALENAQGGLPGGATAITIGPVSLPKRIPGNAVVKGRVIMTDNSHRQVACLALDLDMPAMAALAEDATTQVEARKATVCSGTSDHLKGLAWTSSAGATTVTGTLDEDVSKFSVNADLTLHESFFHKELNLVVPVTYTPGLKQGPFNLTVGPSSDSKEATSLPKSIALKPTVDGKVTIEDSNAQEILCLTVGAKDVMPVLVV